MFVNIHQENLETKLTIFCYLTKINYMFGTIFYICSNIILIQVIQINSKYTK